MKRFRIGLIHSFDRVHSDQIDGLRIALGGFGVGRIPPHITLIPPTNLHPRDVEGELYRLRKIASETKPFRVSVGPVGTFFPVSPVLYLSVAGGGVDQMTALQRRLASVNLYKPSSRPFVPHVTLMDPANEKEVTAASELLETVLFTQDVTSFEMMLSPAQGYWEVSSDFRFVPPRRVHAGGIELEVFVHGSGDLAIYRLSNEQGVAQSLFWPHPDRRLRIDGQRNLVLSLYGNGQLVASGSASYHSSVALVRAVVVRKGLERIGIGSLVIRELLYQLRVAGVDMAFVVTTEAFDQFFQNCGARVVSPMPWLVDYEYGMTLNSWSFSSL